MRASEALALHIDEVRAIIAKYPVSNPRVFGSVARGEDREDSDLNILVEHDGSISAFDLAQLELALARALSARVDVRTPADLSRSITARVQGHLRQL